MFALDVPFCGVLLLCLCSLGFWSLGFVGMASTCQRPCFVALSSAFPFSLLRLTEKTNNRCDGFGSIFSSREVPNFREAPGLKLSPRFLFACPVLFSSTSLLFSSYRDGFTEIACDSISEWPAFRRAA
jgi:hypothetical protein